MTTDEALAYIESGDRTADDPALTLAWAVRLLRQTNAELRVATPVPLTGEAYFIDRDIFVEYVRLILNPAREKEGLSVCTPAVASHLYDVITFRRYCYEAIDLLFMTATPTAQTPEPLRSAGNLPLPPENLKCPFCKESDFDAVGLKIHLNSGHCDKFNATP